MKDDCIDLVVEKNKKVKNSRIQSFNDFARTTIMPKQQSDFITIKKSNDLSQPTIVWFHVPTSIISAKTCNDVLFHVSYFCSLYFKCIPCLLFNFSSSSSYIKKHFWRFNPKIIFFQQVLPRNRLLLTSTA